VLRALLLPVLGGNAKLWTQELEVGGLQVRGRGREVREQQLWDFNVT